MTTEIVFPVGRLDLEGALEAARQLDDLPAAECYVVDFSRLGWIEPDIPHFGAGNCANFQAQLSDS